MFKVIWLLRLLFIFFAGATCAAQALAASPSLCGALGATWIGVNLFFVLGIPSLVVGFWLFSSRNPQAEQEVIDVLRTLFAPIRSLCRILYLALTTEAVSPASTP